jgi:predicted dehydrogenase
MSLDPHTTDRTVRVGVVGLGYWGPNLVRNFASLPGCELAWGCDADPQARERIAARFPGTRLTADLDDLLADPQLDAIVIATPVPTHAELAVRALSAGKHCFVEKPLAQSVADAERTVAAAQASGRVLMVGHLLEYHPGVQKLKELSQSGELGEIYYIYGNRLNLGQLRADERTLSSASCASPPASRRISTSPGWIRTRSDASPWWDPGAWPRSMTWRSREN